MNVWTIFFSGIVYAVLLYVLWDETNRWKAAALLVACAVSIACYGFVRYVNGYADGIEDGTCLAYKSVDYRPDVVVSIPARCQEDE